MTGERVWCRVTVVAASGAPVGSWLVHGTGAADLTVVDVLARLRLLACRHGARLRLSEVSPELARLIELVGLAGQLEREPEGGEDVRGVEEGVDGRDLPG